MMHMPDDAIFVDPEDGSVHEVHLISNGIDDQEIIWKEGDYYVIGNYLYLFMGPCDKNDAPDGSIYVDQGILRTKEHSGDDEGMSKYNIDNIRSGSEYQSRVSWKHGTIDDIADRYTEMEGNILDGYNILANTGSVYIPELRDTDDPMERIIKLMIINMKLKLNEKRVSTEKEYAIDNLRSALNGATKNMSILKFLMWCSVLNLEWEFSLINAPDAPRPMLDNPVTISSKKPLNVDIPEFVQDKRIFYVPLVEPEDPLKRLIKVAIWTLQINLKDYKDKGTSSHCINNLRSGLKGKQKMSIQGMMKWCEILDLMLVIKVTNPETGIWYKSIGYDVFTNSTEEEHATYIKDE